MKHITILLFAFAYFALNTQAQNLTTPPDGGNKKASVTERIGITDITIHYDRPSVKGREGKIWGELVHKGYKTWDLEPAKLHHGGLVQMKIPPCHLVQTF